MRTFAGSIGATLLVAGMALAQPIPVTTCGQVVTGRGILIADLDCSAEADDAVKLSGRLQLAGFTLTGNPGFDVVRCDVGRCVVVGPGTITGGADGVRSDRNARVLEGSIVSGNAGDGVRSSGSARVVDSTVTSNGGDGVRANGSATIRRTTVTANAGNGVDSDATARAVQSTVTTNGFDGLKGQRVVLADSTATGNGASPACATVDDCADLAAAVRPSVSATSTCGTSRDTENGGTWGVCAND